ncbi:MAG TPA: peptidoglycan -binding protein [Azospirillaceae bacterium]|nr:peptidoglycan -binding protein [Azospirillaceae bacterium]
MAGRRGSRASRLDIWPGWVDALSSLLMVVVFLLMVFVLAQFTLSNALQGRDRQLDLLNARISELDDLLAMERGGAETLRADIAKLTEQLRSSLAAREDLQARLDALGAERDTLAARASGLGDQAAQREAELRGQLTEEKRLSAEARREVELLNQQLAALREQLAQLAAALDASEAKSREQGAQIADLGRRLNAALASRVAELSRYRSEFFGRLREVLGDRPDVRIVGDRFVFQSEVLFESGSAELGTGGQAQLAQLAATLKDISGRFPSELNWILRVDGHTDVVPIRSARFPSNWELSTARATSVVQFLITQGIPPERLAATGFGEFQPLEPGATAADALARNRRIEIKLDQR